MRCDAAELTRQSGGQIPITSECRPSTPSPWHPQEVHHYATCSTAHSIAWTPGPSEDGRKFRMFAFWPLMESRIESPPSIARSWSAKSKSNRPVLALIFGDANILFTSEGFRDIADLKGAYKDKIEDLKKKATVPGATAPLETSTTPTDRPAPDSTSQQPPASSQIPRTSSGPKTLSSFLDVPKILQLEQKEIEYIWRLRHASNPNSLCAVIPTTTYNAMAAVAREHPHFVLPLPREEKGAQIHLLQWSFLTPTTSSVLFTELAEYKLRQEYSQPHTVVTHHLDLSDPKGLVLLEGSVSDGRGISVEDAKWLLMCLQKFYGQGAERTPRRELLKKFSRGDGDFNVEQLLEEAERI